MQLQDGPGTRLGAAHAELCSVLALRLAGRVSPSRVVDLYAAALELDSDEAHWVRTNVERRAGGTTAHRRKSGALLRFRDWMRLHRAPFNDAALATQLEQEFARCRYLLARLASRTVVPHPIPEAKPVADGAVIALAVPSTEPVPSYIKTISARPALANLRQRKQLLSGRTAHAEARSR
jgi:hypothetical protein